VAEAVPADEGVSGDLGEAGEFDAAVVVLGPAIDVMLNEFVGG
jgi:hypothetical protein